MTHPSKKKYANVYTKKKYEGGASEKMKAEVTEAAKKERDRLQAQHTIPRGRVADRPGPHKSSTNRRDLTKLLPFVPTDIREKVIKFADEFDEKQHEKWEAKQTKKKMKKRAKKLSAYESYT